MRPPPTKRPIQSSKWVGNPEYAAQCDKRVYEQVDSGF